MIYRRNTELLEAALGDELVALEPVGGQCFGFNSVAFSVWRLLEQPRSFGDLKAALLTEFDVDERQCAAELDELLADLQDKKLVRAEAR